MSSIWRKNAPWTTTVIAAVFVAPVLALGACSDDTTGAETGIDVEDIQEEEAPAELTYDGYYDSDFYDDVVSYDGQQVTVTAEVNEVRSTSAFSIAGIEDTGVEDLLVISAGDIGGLEPGVAVEVTGTVHQSFDLATVEEEIGADLDDALYEDWDAQPYIEASAVDASVPEP